MDDVDWRVDDKVTKVRQVEVREMTRRWTCAVGHRVEADTEEELVRRVQEHMRQDHGMEVSRERILRDLREED